jgi:DNA-binding HxlR family transcriptional regulator
MKCLPTCPGITPEIAASGVEKALKVLGGRWKPIILFYLFRDGTLRLSKLERAIPGITQKMLIQQLRSLELDGVVSRLVHPVVPPKVEYSVTPRGQDLYPALDELLVLGTVVESPTLRAVCSGQCAEGLAPRFLIG